MTKKQLLVWSGVRDFLDLIVIGQIPGINWLLDIPMLILHLQYAGPMALFTLLEALPGVGFAPIWTIAAMCYPDFDKTKTVEAEAEITPATLEIEELPQGEWMVLDDPPRRRVASRVVKQLRNV